MKLKKGKYTVATDEELVGFLSDNQSNLALNELYARYGHLVLGLCLKYLKQKEDAEDKELINIFSSALESNDLKLDVLKKINLKTYPPIAEILLPIVLKDLDANKIYSENEEFKKIFTKNKPESLAQYGRG